MIRHTSGTVGVASQIRRIAENSAAPEGGRAAEFVSELRTRHTSSGTHRPPATAGALAVGASGAAARGGRGWRLPPEGGAEKGARARAGRQGARSAGPFGFVVEWRVAFGWSIRRAKQHCLSTNSCQNDGNE